MKTFRVRLSNGGNCPHDEGSEWYLVAAKNAFGAVRFMLRGGMIDRTIQDLDGVDDVPVQNLLDAGVYWSIGNWR
jgi:hypothetical protein